MSNWGYWIALASGVLVGNWVFRPFVISNSTHADGFAVGAIAAILVLSVDMIVKCFL